MNYLPRSKPRGLTRKYYLVAGVFLLGIFVLHFFGNTLVGVVAPLWEKENRASAWLSGLTDFLQSKNQLIRENQRLEEELYLSEVRLSSQEGLLDREVELLDLLGRRKERGGILSSVLVHPPQNPYDIMIIDIGRDEGVEEGDRVFITDGPVLGRVEEVMRDTSKVVLLSTSGEETQAVLERGGVPVTLMGKGGGNFSLELGRGVEVLKGDRVVTADVEAELIAVVEEVVLRPTDALQKVTLRSPLNIFSLRYVFVAP